MSTKSPPQDAMFLWTETPETMMHVASLMPFTPPADAGPTYLRDVLDEAREEPVLSPWNMKLTHPFLFASEAAVKAANLAISVFGGYGYVDEYPVHKYMRDARVMTLYEGTSQIQKLLIGRAETGISAFL